MIFDDAAIQGETSRIGERQHYVAANTVARSEHQAMFRLSRKGRYRGSTTATAARSRAVIGRTRYSNIAYPDLERDSSGVGRCRYATRDKPVARIATMRCIRADPRSSGFRGHEKLLKRRSGWISQNDEALRTRLPCQVSPQASHWAVPMLSIVHRASRRWIAVSERASIGVRHAGQCRACYMVESLPSR